MRFKVEVEYTDHGASMAGAACGTLNRAEFIDIECENSDSINLAVREHFKNKMYYCGLKRIGEVITL
jgi:hypothetical protein